MAHFKFWLTEKTVDVGYLLESIDLEIHIKTVNLSRAIFAADPLRNYVTSEMAPGLATVPIDATEEQFKDWIVSTYDSGYHPLGSVPMLPEEDGGAVDSKLRVYGTKNVRVIGMFEEPQRSALVLHANQI